MSEKKCGNSLRLLILKRAVNYSIVKHFSVLVKKSNFFHYRSLSNTRISQNNNKLSLLKLLHDFNYVQFPFKALPILSLDGELKYLILNFHQCPLIENAYIWTFAWVLINFYFLIKFILTNFICILNIFFPNDNKFIIFFSDTFIFMISDSIDSFIERLTDREVMLKKVNVKEGCELFLSNISDFHFFFHTNHMRHTSVVKCPPILFRMARSYEYHLDWTWFIKTVF